MLESILRVRSAMTASGLPRSTIYRRIRQGLWPRPVKLGPRSVGWPASEISALNGARIAGKTDDEIRDLVQRLEVARASDVGGAQ